MEEEIIKELHAIAINIEELGVLIQNNSRSFWNTQWFAALIGAISALSITFLKEVVEKRSRRMNEIYNWLMGNKWALSLDSFVDSATHTSYSKPDKPIGEKVVIELRRHCKYWRFPLSKVRYLFQKYEKALWKLPNLPNREREKIKNSDEYVVAEKLFRKISELVEKKTGENWWTYRQRIAR